MVLPEELLCAWAQQVERHLLKRLGSRALARDIAHEAVARLLAAARSGRSPSDPRAWVFRTARNLAVDEVRRHLPYPLGYEALGLLPARSASDAEASWQIGPKVLTCGELVRLLPQAMAGLPDHYHRLIVAHYHHGLTCEAVAVRERISVANVKVRLFRARRRLRQLLLEAARGGS